jgi:hypothetical protein
LTGKVSADTSIGYFLTPEPEREEENDNENGG